MRVLLALLVLLAIIAGCTTEGDQIFNSYNYYYPDSTENPDTTEPYGVYVVTPTRNEIFETWYDWVPSTNPNYNGCPWGYRADTVIYATVRTNLPGSVAEARLFLRYYSSGGFSEQTVLSNPIGNPFTIQVYHAGASFANYLPNDLDLEFWVSVTTEDSLSYGSTIVPFQLVPRVNYDMQSEPAPPAADTLTESNYQQIMYIEWCAQSPDADSFFVFIRENDEGEVARISVPGTQRETYYWTYLPLADYAVWVSASNEYGESLPSDIMHLTTREPILPEDLRATTYADSHVDLYWYNRSYPDSILVGRRGTLSEWSTIKSLACSGNSCPSYFNDTTAVSNSVNYYRIGMQFTNGTWWGQDSVGVWIP